MDSSHDHTEEYKKSFFKIIDNVSFRLLEDKDNFYGYFLLQMEREISTAIAGPTAVNFKGAKYVIYFNPDIFLQLTEGQMESVIKHEILHIVSMHLTRAKEISGKYTKTAINMAMDIVVNEYLNPLPPYAVTLRSVNSKYALKLEHYGSFEYYAERLQIAMDLMDEKKETLEELTDSETSFQVATTHDLWEETDEIDEKTLTEFTEKVISESQKGVVPAYLTGIFAALKSQKEELPWNIYLHKLMGMVVGSNKKTITRRNRRQPERLDLRGELKDHHAKIIVAVDISGSIGDDEFKRAMIEVLGIVKNYRHEITMVECDNQIRNVYKVRSERDLRDRMNTKGATRFSPVFEYANGQKVNLLIYFTDGEGEANLSVVPRGYKVLWILSGDGEKLSLEKSNGVVKKLSTFEKKEPLLDALDVDKGGFSMNNQERN